MQGGFLVFMRVLNTVRHADEYRHPIRSVANGTDTRSPSAGMPIFIGITNDGIR
jgi:hypothetical protein